MLTPLCCHVRTDGTHCGSPALSGKPWCYFHNRLRHRHRRFRLAEARRVSLKPAQQHHDPLTLEHPESIQLALSIVINSLATNSLDTKLASALLYSLQLASLNAARPQETEHGAEK
jgi:predicted ATPase